MSEIAAAAVVVVQKAALAAMERDLSKAKATNFNDSFIKMSHLHHAVVRLSIERNFLSHVTS